MSRTVSSSVSFTLLVGSLLLSGPQIAVGQTACIADNAGIGFCCKGCDNPLTGAIEGLAWGASNAGAPPGNTIGGPYYVGIEHGTVVYTDAPAVGIRQAEGNPIWFALPAIPVQHIVSDLSAPVSDELEILMTDAFAAVNPTGPPCGDDTIGILPLVAPVDYIEIYGAQAPNDGSRGALIADAAAIYLVSGGTLSPGGIVSPFPRPAGAFINATKNNTTVTLNYTGGSRAVDLWLGCGGGIRSAVVPPMKAPTPIAAGPVITAAPPGEGALLAHGSPPGIRALAMSHLALGPGLRHWLDPRRSPLVQGLQLLTPGSRVAWAQGATAINLAGGMPPQGSSSSPDGIVFLVLVMLLAVGLHRLRLARA